MPAETVVVVVGFVVVFVVFMGVVAWVDRWSNAGR
jgi:hypothetical protein